MKKPLAKPINLIAAALALVFLSKLLLADIMIVQGRSMEPKLLPDQIVWINRAAYGLQIPFFNFYLLVWKKPKIGDIVVYQNPKSGVLVIKRCIGIAGDPIIVLDQALQVGGKLLPLKQEQAKQFMPYSKIPSGMIFTVGDNLAHSYDSRDYGFIPMNKLSGKIFFLP